MLRHFKAIEEILTKQHRFKSSSSSSSSSLLNRVIQEEEKSSRNSYALIGQELSCVSILNYISTLSASQSKLEKHLGFLISTIFNSNIFSLL
jgi:hypothetical protein